MATPRIDALLATKEGFPLEALDALDDEDRADVVARAFDDTDPHRLRAIGILVLFDPESAGEAIRRVIEEDRDPALMAGALTVAATAGPLAVPLAMAAATSPHLEVALAAWLTLQRVASAEDLAALGDLAKHVSGLTFRQAMFAQSVIAYRAGLPGFELPVPPFEDRLDFDADVEIVVIDNAPADEQDFAVLARHSSGELYMLSLSLEATRAFDCAGSHMLVALDANVLASVPDRLFEAPALTGLIALRDPFGIGYSVQYLVLTWPDGAGGVNVAVHQPQGEQVYFGTGEIELETLFVVPLQAIARPGAVPIAVTAVAATGSLDFSQANSAAEISELTPKLAIEIDPDEEA